MQCIDAERFLPVLLDRDPDVWGTNTLLSHLYMCSDCREIFANMLLMKAMGNVARSQWGRASTPDRVDRAAERRKVEVDSATWHD
jgi:predicted anti-sigma-YlaC factor YlaD